MKKIIASVMALVMAVCGMIHRTEAVPLLRVTKLGTYKVTAYSGNVGSTYGASGKTLVPGKHVSASGVFPFGTMLYISGIGIVTVEDRFDEGDEWFTDNNGEILDIYLDSYEEACEWGLKELTVYEVKKIEL